MGGVDQDYVLLAQHIREVQKRLMVICANLQNRAVVHDKSKYSEGELPLLRLKSTLQGVEYGSEVYFKILKENKEVISLHHANNSHHPEHRGGLDCMSLLDVVEMFCDWSAAAALNGTDLVDSLRISCQRYNVPAYLQAIFLNTYIELGWESDA
jgi:hypothetical protein